jgi:2-C-methyl-D-erythritol 4-phosphate cytidylyltransferase
LKKTVAVIVAAGLGKRMKSKTPKAFLTLLKKPVLAYTVAPFEKSPLVNEIIIVVPRGYEKYCRRQIVNKFKFRKVVAIVTGGKERQDSVRAAIEQIDPDTDLVAIHDGARPLVTAEIIQRGWEKCKKEKAVVIAVPVKDTIKRAAHHIIRDTLDRGELWAMQTPQFFDYDLIFKAYQKADRDGFYATDDALLVERLGKKVHVVEGSYRNIKITTPEDMIMAAGLLQRRK